MIPKSEWVWMPHAGHLIVGNMCRFHLNTRIGNVIVSTVGEYLPGDAVREIFAKSRGVTLKGQGDEREYDYMKQIGFEEIGCGRKYETMVFFAEEAPDQCCPWRQKSGHDIDMNGYNDQALAFKGHYEMCEKYANHQPNDEESIREDD